MNWVKVIQLLPELIQLAQTLLKKRELQVEEPPMDKKELKDKIKKINKAIEDGDEKALNDVFNSL